jgi:hypothetical protein
MLIKELDIKYSQEISDYIHKMNVKHNLSIQNKQYLNNLITRIVNTHPQYDRIKCYLPHFNISIS